MPDPVMDDPTSIAVPAGERVMTFFPIVVMALAVTALMEAAVVKLDRVTLAPDTEVTVVPWGMPPPDTAMPGRMVSPGAARTFLNLSRRMGRVWTVAMVGTPEIVRVSWLNVRPLGRVPVRDTTGESPSSSKTWLNAPKTLPDMFSLLVKASGVSTPATLPVRV